jgi:L,D-transpeptidase YbiS
MIKTLLWGILALFIGTGLAGVAFLGAPQLRDYMRTLVWSSAVSPVDTTQVTTTSLDKLQKKTQALRARYEALTPDMPYLIVDTSSNRFQVMTRQEVLHRGICSTGSYVLLKSADKRQWLFATPRGQLRVQAKKKAPVWHKPDWAFIEEGLPVPPRNAPERFEAGVLGEYALALGDGYLIHGTLYKRQLGMPVTHGCIRLGDEDLRVVYGSMAEGSKVFIY